MSKAKNDDPKASKGYSPNKLQWVNPQTNAEDITWLESNSSRYVELVFDLMEDIQEDERVSIKRDPQSSRWLAILFAGDGDARNSGTALSLRGASPFDALLLLAYFHNIRFEGEYPATDTSDLGRWG